MTDQIPINIAYEDLLSGAVLMRLLEETSRGYIIGDRHHARGFGWLKTHARAFNSASAGMPYLLLTDLDKTECAPALISNWISQPKHANFLFRVACHQIEAWLLADAETFAHFLGIQTSRIPRAVDEIPDAKLELINLVRRSRKRRLREDILPRASSVMKQGPNYNQPLCEYVAGVWRPSFAALNSPSLHKARNALRIFEPRWQE